MIKLYSSHVQQLMYYNKLTAQMLLFQAASTQEATDKKKKNYDTNLFT